MSSTEFFYTCNQNFDVMYHIIHTVFCLEIVMERDNFGDIAYK
jgi:hypothetical protein